MAKYCTIHATLQHLYWFTHRTPPPPTQPSMNMPTAAVTNPWHHRDSASLDIYSGSASAFTIIKPRARASTDVSLDSMSSDVMSSDVPALHALSSRSFMHDVNEAIGSEYRGSEYQGSEYQREEEYRGDDYEQHEEEFRFEDERNPGHYEVVKLRSRLPSLRQLWSLLSRRERVEEECKS